MNATLGKAACHLKSLLNRCFFVVTTIGYNVSHVSTKDFGPSLSHKGDLMLRDIIGQCKQVLDKNSGKKHLTVNHFAIFENMMKYVESGTVDLGSFGKFELVDSTLVESDTRVSVPVIMYELKGTDGLAFLFWGGLYALPLLLVHVTQKRVYLFQDSYSVQPLDWQLSTVNLLLSLRGRQLKKRISLRSLLEWIKDDEATVSSGISECILFFGFSNNFGHYLWNELSGVYDLLKSGLMDRVDCVAVGQYDFCGFAKVLESRYGKKVRYLPLHAEEILGRSDAGMMKKQDGRFLLRFNDIVLTESCCLFLRDHLAEAVEKTVTSGVPATDTSFFNVCIKVRLHNRVCQNQSELIRVLIDHFSNNHPIFTQFGKSKVRLLVDGFSSYPGMSRFDKDVIRSEKEQFAGFVKDAATFLGNSVELVDIIGLTVNQKAHIARNLDLYLSPVGSGGELYTWIYKVPSIY